MAARRLAARIGLGAAAAARDAWRLDAVASATPLAAKELRRRRILITSLRHAVQGATALLVLEIGLEFVGFVRGLERGGAVMARPAGVEGFLPISGLMSLRHLWITGEVHPVHPAALAILVAVLATSITIKKAFCSWLCPIGVVSETLAAMSERLFRRRLALPRLLDLPLRGLKYLLLAFFLQAIFVALSSEELKGFLDSPYNRVADIKMLLFFERLSPVGLSVLGGLAAASFLVPYFWCRYLCPYGALLGIVSLAAPLKVTRHAPSCIDCGLCTKACPSRLPVDRLARVRSDECFGCLSCIAACPVSRALRVETPSPWRRAVRPALLAALVVLLFGGTIVAARAGGWWRNSISDSEYAARLLEIDDPVYDHTQAASGRTPELRVTGSIHAGSGVAAEGSLRAGETPEGQSPKR